MATVLPQNTQVVIAHYNEDLDWLEDIVESCLFYTKGPKDPIYPERTQRLPNIGREGHTFLHHLVATYDNLPEVTCFLQGRVDDHTNLSAKEILEKASQTTPGMVTTFPWRELELFDLWDGIPWELYPSWGKWSAMQCRELKQSPAQMFTDLLGFPQVPAAIGFAPGALFAVHRDTIQQYPKSFYETLLNELFLGDMAHVNPATGHYMERFWLSIFNPSEYICWQYDTDTAVQPRNSQGQLSRGNWHRTPRGVKIDLMTVEPSLRAEMERRESGSLTPPSVASLDSDAGSSADASSDSDSDGSSV